MVSVQQMNLLPENASQNDGHFSQSLFTQLQDHLAMLKLLWLRNHHSLYYYMVSHCYSYIHCLTCTIHPSNCLHILCSYMHSC